MPQGQFSPEYLAWLKAQKEGQDPSAPTGTPAIKKGIIEPQTSTFGTLIDWLNRPANAVASGFLAGAKNQDVGQAMARGFKGGKEWQWNVPDAERHNFAEVLGANGMEEGWGRTIAGLGLDIATDPTNLIPGKVFSSGAKYLGKGVQELGNLAAKAPGVGKAIESGMNKLTPFRELRNLPEKYQDLAKVTSSRIHAARSIAPHDIEKGLTPLLVGAKKAGQDVPEAMKQAMRIADTSDTAAGASPEVQALVDYIDKFGKERAGKEVKAGILKAGDVKPNYVPKYYPDEALKPTHIGEGRLRKPGFTVESKLQTFAQAEKAGKTPNYNMLDVLAKRQQSGERAIIHQNFAKELFDPNASELKGLYQPRPKGTTALPVTADGRKFRVVKPGIYDEATEKLFKDHVFHPDVAQDVERMLTVSAAPDAVVKTYGKILNAWKTSATVVRPAFIERNILSNVFMSLAGSDQPIRQAALSLPKFYIEAGTMLATKAGKLNPEFQLAKELGITSTEFGAIGELGAQTHKTIEKITKTGPAKVIGQTLGTPVNAMRAASKASEDVGRLALYLQQRSIGKTPEQAALHVNKWLINYAEKTPAERAVISKIFPFSTWMTRIVPRLFEGMAKHPQLFSAQEKLKNAMEERVPQGERMLDSERPGWMAQQEFFQMPGEKKGERKFGTVGLPGTDLNILPAPGGTPLLKAVQELLGRVSPAKSFVEAGINRNISTMGDIWSKTPLELKPAGGTLSWLAQTSPEMAEAVIQLATAGQGHMAKQGDAWYAPAVPNHIISQLIPIVEQIGKGSRSGVPGEIPESDPSRVRRNILWAVPSVQRDTDKQYGSRLKSEKDRRVQEAKDLALWTQTYKRK